MDIGLVEAEFAAVGDGEGFEGGLAVAVEARQGQQDGGLVVDHVDAAAAGESFVEVALGVGSVVEGRVGPAQQPEGPNSLSLKLGFASCGKSLG